MNIPIYWECFLIALVGMIIHLIIKGVNLKNKASIANIEWSIGKWLMTDIGSIAAGIGTIFLGLWVIEPVTLRDPQSYYEIGPLRINIVALSFAFIGYVGSDLVTRAFGKMSNAYNEIIDRKTTVADQAEGNVETPTQLPANPNRKP